MGADMLQLPDELLLEVQSYFYLEDLERFNLVCRRFAAVSYRRCQQHRALRSKYRRLTALDEPFGWLVHLLAVLRNYDVQHYIEEIHIPTCEEYWDDIKANSKNLLPSDADIRLVKQAARDSPWISKKDACGPGCAANTFEDFLREIDEGDQDNILAILVPLLPNLRKLELPARRHGGLPMGSLPGVVKRIAKATHAAEHFPTESGLPLTKLDEIVGLNIRSNPMAQLGFGVDFEGLAPFLAIPSVRKLWTLETHEPFFHWPEDLPKSRVQEVQFYQSSVAEPAARALARGIVGPCTMKQEFRMHAHGRQWPQAAPREHWTKIDIPHQEAPEREWTITRFGPPPPPERKLSAASTLVMAARIAAGAVGYRP